LFEAPKEIRNKLLDKINWKIGEIKKQRIFYIRNHEIKMRQKIVFYSSSDLPS